MCDGEKFKLFQDFEGHHYQVTTLMLFKHPILPQFEDKRNKAELRLDLGHIKDVESLQLIWETLVLDMVTGNCPGVTDNEDEGVSGIRLVQKARDDRVNGYRVEIWLLSGDEQNQCTQEIKKYFDNNIKQDLLRIPTDIKWQAIK